MKRSPLCGKDLLVHSFGPSRGERGKRHAGATFAGAITGSQYGELLEGRGTSRDGGRYGGAGEGREKHCEDGGRRGTGGCRSSGSEGGTACLHGKLASVRDNWIVTTLDVTLIPSGEEKTRPVGRAADGHAAPGQLFGGKHGGAAIAAGGAAVVGGGRAMVATPACCFCCILYRS